MLQKDVEDPLQIRKTLFFTMSLCFVSATFLSLINIWLKPIQNTASLMEEKKELLIAAKILDHDGFLYTNSSHKPNAEELTKIMQQKIQAMLIDKEGRWQSFEDFSFEENSYIKKYSSKGFSEAPYLVIYGLMQDVDVGQTDPMQSVEGFIIPVYGLGLWGPIKGYICLEKDGNTIRGVNWHEHQETPGLGAFIANPSWHDTFIEKKIFEEGLGETIALDQIPIGISVVKDGVANVLGDSSKQFSSVDGKSGATISGNAVTEAYRTTLHLYRKFLERRKQGLPL